MVVVAVEGAWAVVVSDSNEEVPDEFVDVKIEESVVIVEVC